MTIVAVPVAHLLHPLDIYHIVTHLWKLDNSQYSSIKMSDMAHWKCGASVAFVAHHQALMLGAAHHPSTRAAAFHTPSVILASRREPDDDDVVFSTFDKVGKALSTPTPGVSSLPIVYPLAFVSAGFILPPATALFLTAFFVGYSFLAKQVVVGDDDDSSMVNFAAFLAAIPSAGLLSPSGFQSVNAAQGLAVVVAVLTLGILAATIAEALPTKDEKLLDEWDDKFDKDYRD